MLPQDDAASEETAGAQTGSSSAGDRTVDGPLQGVRVIEFGQLIAGPCVGTLLGDFGADVIKVEPPGKGDAMRQWGRARHNGHPLWWSVLARNKRSVALNLREASDRRIAAGLCAGADVVIENFRPGTMERWDLGPDDVHSVNPGCVYARMSGYGQRGRYRDRPGFASAGEAIGGLRYINGYPGDAPPRMGISLGDTLAAQPAFQGVLLALYARDARGATGQVVDAAIADACFSLLESAVPEYETCGTVREPSGLITTVEDEIHGTISVPGVVPKLSATPGSIRRPARWEVGADTDDVLRELGISGDRDGVDDGDRRGRHQGTA